jgi:Retron-type reverse transcriptase
MKRFGHLFEKATDLDFIKTTILAAAKGKTAKPGVRETVDRIDDRSSLIREIILSGTYIPSAKFTTIIDSGSGKKRDIVSIPFFPDQCIQWVITKIIQPIVMKGMDPYCCSCVPGRGSGLASKAVRKFLRDDPIGCKWCLQTDIRKFYPSINREILLGKLRSRIKDERFVDLVSRAIAIGPSGLPIGIYSSPWLANFYLQDLDHRIREDMKARHAIRYADDEIVLGPNRRKLIAIKESMEEELRKIGLAIKPNWKIFRTSRKDIDFVGFRFHSNGKVRIRKRIWRSARREILKIHHHGLTSGRAKRLISYYGFIKASSNCNILKKYSIDRTVAEAKRAISAAEGEKA